VFLLSDAVRLIQWRYGGGGRLDRDRVASYMTHIAVLLLLYPLLSFSKQSNLESRSKSSSRRNDHSCHERRLRLLQPAFYSDKDVARRLNMSPSWVRQQRFRKLRGQPNSFDLVPRHIGSGIRYVVAEVEAFIASIEQGPR
jgi:hypothetical protein